MNKNIGNYKVIVNAPHDTKIYIITFETYSTKKNTLSEFQGLGKNCYITKKGMNRIHIHTSKNDWYQGAEIFDVIKYIKEIKNDKIYLTYGHSMGGFAAIEFSNLIDSDFFVAFSPQCSLSDFYMESINDSRWKEERRHLLTESNGLISHNLSGTNQNSSGVVFYDPNFKADKEHALSIDENTNARLIETYGSWHHSGKVVNYCYGLTSLLKRIGTSIQKKQSIDSILDEVDITLKNSDFDKLMKPIPLDELFNINTDIIKKISINSWLNVYRKNRDKKTALFIFFISDFLNTDKAIILINEVKKDNFFSNIIDNANKFYISDKFNKDFISQNYKVFGADPLRNEAIRLEKKGNLNDAIFLMSLARKIRPSGPFINKKLKQYQNTLNRK